MLWDERFPPCPTCFILTPSVCICSQHFSSLRSSSVAQLHFFGPMSVSQPLKEHQWKSSFSLIYRPSFYSFGFKKVRERRIVEAGGWVPASQSRPHFLSTTLSLYRHKHCGVSYTFIRVVEIQKLASGPSLLISCVFSFHNFFSFTPSLFTQSVCLPFYLWFPPCASYVFLLVSTLVGIWFPLPPYLCSLLFLPLFSFPVITTRPSLPLTISLSSVTSTLLLKMQLRQEAERGRETKMGD